MQILADATPEGHVRIILHDGRDTTSIGVFERNTMLRFMSDLALEILRANHKVEGEWTDA